jgi:hypothetical protein
MHKVSSQVAEATTGPGALSVGTISNIEDVLVAPL